MNMKNSQAFPQDDLDRSTEAYQQYQDAIKKVTVRLEVLQKQYAEFVDKICAEKALIEKDLKDLKERFEL